MFCGLAHQLVDSANHFGKVFLVGDLASPIRPTCGLAVLVVHINQVDVARHIQLACAQLAHAHYPKSATLCRACQTLRQRSVLWSPVNGVKLLQAGF